jgi:hypothetical protein
MRIDLDTPVICVDGPAGQLQDVVIDPTTQRLTHLVVQPHDANDRVRLMPIEHARADTASAGIALDCSIATFLASDPIQESAYLRMGDLVDGGPDWTVGIQEMFSLPEYGSLGPEVMGAGMTMEYDQHVAVSYHRIPVGGVEIRRSSSVTSSDSHHLGHVVGFVTAEEGAITQLILEHGHLWTKRMVAIPSRAIERFETDELTLSLTADRVGGMKSLPGHHHWG